MRDLSEIVWHSPVMRGARRTAEGGATAVEYALIIGLVAIAVIAALVLLGSNVSGLFQASGSEVSETIGGGSGEDPEPEPEQEPLGANAPSAGGCTSGDKSGTYNCVLSAPAAIDGVSVTYDYQCTGSCGNVTWNRPSLGLSGWGATRAATVTLNWTFPGSPAFESTSGTITFDFD